jgi:hypothetical protein
MFEGSISGYGLWSVPLQGSHVFVFFENGNILNPRYFATAPGLPTDINHGFEDGKGFSDPDKTYPDKLDEPDFHKLARGEVDDITREDKYGDIEFGPQYPHNTVFYTHGNLAIELDSTPDKERIHIFHPSNSYIEIDVNGNMVIKNSNDRFDKTEGNITKLGEGNKDTYLEGDEDKTVNGSLTVTIGADKTVSISGDCTIEVGGNCNISVGGNVVIDGAMVLINS